MAGKKAADKKQRNFGWRNNQRKWEQHQVEFINDEWNRVFINFYEDWSPFEYGSLKDKYLRLLYKCQFQTAHMVIMKLEGHKLREIGEIFQVSAETVRKRINRFKKMLIGGG
jgi:hypothetical protein